MQTRRLAEYCQGALPMGRKPCIAQGTVFCALPSHLPMCGSLTPVPMDPQGHPFIQDVWSVQSQPFNSTTRPPTQHPRPKGALTPSPVTSSDAAGITHPFSACTQPAPPTPRGGGINMGFVPEFPDAQDLTGTATLTRSHLWTFQAACPARGGGRRSPRPPLYTEGN